MLGMTGRSPGTTTWHITFGTYGARLHGGERLTVRRTGERTTTEIIRRDPDLEDVKRGQMRAAPVHLTREQRLFIQREIPSICERGGWRFRVCSADHDHVHVLLDVDSAIRGEKVRRLLKRWLTQALNERWPRQAAGRWWAEQGSNKAIRDEAYLANAQAYIEKQRAR
jgi:REP element-mobilizing transposase RayT